MKSLFLVAMVLVSVSSAHAANAVVCSERGVLEGDHVQLTIPAASLPLEAGKNLGGVLETISYGEKETYQIDCQLQQGDDGELVCGQSETALNLGFGFELTGTDLQNVSLTREYHGGYGHEVMRGSLSCR